MWYNNNMFLQYLGLDWPFMPQLRALYLHKWKSQMAGKMDCIEIMDCIETWKGWYLREIISSFQVETVLTFQ